MPSTEYEVWKLSTWDVHYLQTATYGVYKALGDKVREQPEHIRTMTSSSKMFALLQTGKYVYTADQTGCQIKRRQTRDCNVVILPQTYLAAGIAIALPKGALHKKYFDQV